MSVAVNRLTARKHEVSQAMGDQQLAIAGFKPRQLHIARSVEYPCMCVHAGRILVKVEAQVGQTEVRLGNAIALRGILHQKHVARVC